MKSKPFVMRTDFHNQVIIGRTGHFTNTHILPEELEEVITMLNDVLQEILFPKPKDGSLTDQELEKLYP